MIATWEEINSRYDAIKDHKPRATKKLKELGEILASAYLLDPQRADEMWQYIIELNIKDNITFSKFYIAQVFNKLTDNLPPEEAVEYVSMRPERVRLMLIYGYDGSTLNHVVYTIVGSLVLDGMMDEAVETLSMLEEKFSTQDGLSLFSLYSVFNSLCESLEEKPEQIDYAFRYRIPNKNVLSFLDACCDGFKDEYIQSIVQARKAILKDEIIKGKEEVNRILHCLSEASTHSNYDFAGLFSDFLYFERDLIGDEAENIIFDYCSEAETVRLPLVAYGEDDRLLAVSNWYRTIFSGSPRILRVLFEKQSCQEFLKNTLRQLMYDGDWKALLQYLVLGLNQETEYGPSSYLEFIKEEIRYYLSVKDKKVEFKDGQWWVSLNEDGTFRTTIDRPRVSADNVGEFIQILGQVCVLTSGSSVNEQLVEDVRSFVTKETGNVKALQAMGMEVDVDNRTELEKFRDYAERESTQRTSCDNSYNQRQKEYEFIRNIQRETGTYGVETGKLLAKQPQILSFFFLHDAHSFSSKADIILGALLDDNYPAALKCVDYMIETATYPNFSERNSWSVEMKNTINNLLRAVFRKNTSEYEESYSDGITLTVIQIAEKCLPYLGGDDANDVKAELLKLKPADDDTAEFIRQLMQDVDDYTAEKKPRGYSKRINNISSGIIRGIEVLSQLNRMDIVAQILLKITAGRKYIAGPSYESWMTSFTRVTDEQRLELYSLIPDVYATFIEASDRMTALRFLLAFGKLGNSSVFKTLRDQVLQKHGYIDGMASCFHYSEETATPIALCKNKVFEATFLYWNAGSFSIQSGVHSAEVTLRLKNHHEEYISLFASDITINGIALSELKRQEEKGASDRERISYYLGSGEEDIELLSLYWGNQKERFFREILEVSFSVIAQSDDKDIAQAGPFTVMYNPKDDTFAMKA